MIGKPYPWKISHTAPNFTTERHLFSVHHIYITLSGFVNSLFSFCYKHISPSGLAAGFSLMEYVLDDTYPYILYFGCGLLYYICYQVSLSAYPTFSLWGAHLTALAQHISVLPQSIGCSYSLTNQVLLFAGVNTKNSVWFSEKTSAFCYTSSIPHLFMYETPKVYNDYRKLLCTFTRKGKVFVIQVFEFRRGISSS